MMSQRHALSDTRLKPTLERTLLTTLEDGYALFQAVLDGRLEPMPRRPTKKDYGSLVFSGSVSIYKDADTQATRLDGLKWPFSYYENRFRIYPGSDGLHRKNLRVDVNNVTFKLISYYTNADIASNSLKRPADRGYHHSTIRDNFIPTYLGPNESRDLGRQSAARQELITSSSKTQRRKKRNSTSISLPGSTKKQRTQNPHGWHGLAAQSRDTSTICDADQWSQYTGGSTTRSQPLPRMAHGTQSADNLFASATPYYCDYAYPTAISIGHDPSGLPTWQTSQDFPYPIPPLVGRSSTAPYSAPFKRSTTLNYSTSRMLGNAQYAPGAVAFGCLFPQGDYTSYSHRDVLNCNARKNEESLQPLDFSQFFDPSYSSSSSKAQNSQGIDWYH